MKITQKLLGLLHRVFDKDPHAFTAMRLDYDGDMVWTIADKCMKTTVTGGSGVSLSIDLSKYTVGQLAVFLGGQQGYSISYVDTSALSLLSARVLIDGSADIASSNGDLIQGYTNVLWSYIDANANELELARTQIGEMLKQMSTTTAAGEWLDNLGAMYGVGRLQGELDSSYGPRIVTEVLRPKSNNVALENAISFYTGQATTVTDVIEYGAQFPLYDNSITRNSQYKYTTSARPLYGLFDVQYGYDLLGGVDPTSFKQTIETIIERLRAAGTHLRSLSLQGSTFSDSLTPPTDLDMPLVLSPILADTLTAPTDPTLSMAAVIGAFADSLTAPTDSEKLNISYNYTYSSLRKYNGVIQRMGVQTVAETF